MMRAVLYATVIALVCSLIGTPIAVKFFARRGYGQEIREDGPQIAPGQARHAHHGRHRHRALHPVRLLRHQAG